MRSIKSRVCEASFILPSIHQFFVCFDNITEQNYDWQDCLADKKDKILVSLFTAEYYGSCRGASVSGSAYCGVTSLHYNVPYTVIGTGAKFHNACRTAPTRAFSKSEAPTSAFIIKNLLKHYANRALLNFAKSYCIDSSNSPPPPRTYPRINKLSTFSCSRVNTCNTVIIDFRILAPEDKISNISAQKIFHSINCHYFRL